MIDTIILDLDGPLLDGVDRHYECYCRILQRFGYRPIAKKRYWDQKRLRVDRRTLLAQSHAEETYDEFLSHWIQQIESPELLALDRLQPEVLTLLQKWRDSGVKLILATMRNRRENTLCQLERLQLEPLFNEIFITGSADTGGKAAAVQSYLKQHAGVDNEAIWVGDTEVDIDASHKLQLPLYAVTCGLRTEEKLREFGAENVCRDLRDVERTIDVGCDSTRGVA
jgi:phosphoglycolate phosphatase-like HAD superfamily hydrolase